MTLRKRLDFTFILMSVIPIIGYGFLSNPESSVDELVLGVILVFLAFLYSAVFLPIKKTFSHLASLISSLSKHNIQLGKDKTDLQKLTEVVNGQLKDIQKATEFINDIKSGNLGSTFSSDDSSYNTALMTALAELRNQMVAIAQEEKERHWVSEGMAKFVDILRGGNGKAEEFYDQIIQNIVKYLDANQGGLFVVSEKDDKKILHQAASYAYERKKFLTKEIEIGEGLIGQTYLEQKTIVLKEVPANYVNVTSGLGKATPRCVVIVPFILNDSVECVLELASFTEFKDYQIKFLERLGESIASTIYHLNINDNTKRLLAEAQQTTEEMKSQEEELKQNMEELEATQEEMRRKEKEMIRLLEKMEASEKQLKENLDQINVMKKRDEERSKEIIKTTEEHRKTLIDIVNKLPQKIFLKDKDGKFILANEAVAEAHHLTVDELLGKSDFDFFTFEQATEYRSKELEVIATGGPVYFPEEVFKDPSGNDKILQTTKMPFYIRYLDQVGLLGIQTDITEVKKAREGK
jgi:PAS domain S-box-containing protein